MIQHGFQRLVLLGSAGYQRAELPLDDAVSLIAPNNTGKTSLINALQFLLIIDRRRMDFGAHDFRWSSKTEERNALWEARHRAHWSILASRPGATALVTDICVPISRLAQAVEETRADIAQASIPGPILGHAGDGNFHAILLVEQHAKQALAFSDRGYVLAAGRNRHEGTGAELLADREVAEMFLGG